MPTNKDVEKRLRDLGNLPGTQYPAGDKFATKTDFLSQADRYRKQGGGDGKKSCPLAVLSFALPLLVAARIIAGMLS